MGDNLFNAGISGLPHLLYGAHQSQGQNGSSQQSPPDANYSNRCCHMCGFNHGRNGAHDAPTQCGKGQMGGKKGGSGDSGGKGCSSGCGDKGSKGDGGGKGSSDKGSSGNGGGDKGSNSGSKGKRGSERGAGDADRDSGSGSDGDGDKGLPSGGKAMNVEDPYVTPEWLPNYLAYGFSLFLAICLLNFFLCSGSESVWDCLKLSSLTGGLSSCDLNEGVNKFFEKNGAGAKNQSVDSKNKSTSTGTGGPAPAHLEDRMKQVKKALRNANCKKYGSDEKCSGLVDYAGVMAGGAIVGTGNTDIVRNQMLCRCNDPKLYKHVCFPGEGKCSDCSCDSIPIDTLITEEEKLIPGKCWAFRGVGELQIKLFYPIIVLGTTIHHPSKARLPPGYFASAPKDFQLWGLGGNNTEPYHFGKFEFKENGGSTQIFEVQNPSTTFYQQVKFNFTSNHGSPNYTALYKVELHGVIDN